MNPYFRITKYSHFFTIRDITPSGLTYVLNFSTKYVHKTFVRERGKFTLKPTRVFAARIGTDEFRFHIGQYSDFIKFLDNKGLNSSYYTVTDKPMYEPAIYNYKVHPRYEEREYQANIINFVIQSEADDLRSRMVALYTGGGKGFISLASVAKLRYRTMVIVRPRYINKWAKEVTEVLDVKPKEIITVQGGDELESLLYLANENAIEAKFIIISLNTLKTYFDEFKIHGGGIIDEGYPFAPEEMFEKLKIGTLIFDEVHEHLYAIFRTMLHTHVPKVIALSATLLSPDAFINNMQHIMFPKEIRYSNVSMKKYIKVRAFSYGFKDMNMVNKIKTTARGSTVYNHIEFEKSIMHNKIMINNYLSLITKLVELNFLDRYNKGEKCIVYAASIAMCDIILNHLKKKYPRLDIRRFVEDDPEENIYRADITVSTLLSGGTAFDIAGLITILMTNNIQSPVANLQVLGRLREVKDRDVVFAYIYNKHIKKQIDYHFVKKEQFADRIASFKEYALEEGI